jgi:hypothetical protein
MSSARQMDALTNNAHFCPHGLSEQFSNQARLPWTVPSIVLVVMAFVACSYQQPVLFARPSQSRSSLLIAAPTDSTNDTVTQPSRCALKSREVGMPLDQYNALRAPLRSNSPPLILERSPSISCVIESEPHWDPEVRERIRSARASVLAAILPCANRISGIVSQRYEESQMVWRMTINRDGRIRLATPALPITPFSECVATEIESQRIGASPLPPLVVALPPSGWQMFLAAPPARIPAPTAKPVLTIASRVWRAVLPHP